MLSERRDVGSGGPPHRRTSALLVALVALLASACGPSLPADLLTAVESIEQDLDFSDRAVAESRQSFEEFLSAPGRERLLPYSEREGWADRFEEARQELAHAREILRDEILPAVERDQPEEADALRSQVKRARASLDHAGELRREPRQRAEFFLRLANGEGGGIVDALRERVTAADAVRTEQAGDVAKAAVDHPKKKDDLAQRVATLDADEARAREALIAAGNELRRLGTSDEDLSALAAQIGTAEVATKALEVGRADLEARVGQLYRSYSKTLIDMRFDTLVSVGRTSWNDYVDFPSEHEYVYATRIVPEAFAELFESWGERPLAVGNRIQIDRAAWDALELDPRENMTRGDTASEFWIADTDARYFHRYTYVEGDSHRDSDWEPVDEDLFWDNYENLGMDIVAKPYGLYEDEALNDAMPPGFAYVGDPRYGRWETTPDGRRRWSWLEAYGFYYLMFGPRRHYYYWDEWDPWYRDRRGHGAWYGAGGGYYGTRGTMLGGSPRYASSRFGRSGGFQRAASSFRGAGPSGRGGGPGARGK